MYIVRYRHTSAQGKPKGYKYLLNENKLAKTRRFCGKFSEETANRIADKYRELGKQEVEVVKLEQKELGATVFDVPSYQKFYSSLVDSLNPEYTKILNLTCYKGVTGRASMTQWNRALDFLKTKPNFEIIEDKGYFLNTQIRLV